MKMEESATVIRNFIIIRLYPFNFILCICMECFNPLLCIISEYTDT